MLFVKEVLGVKPDPWQEEFLGHIAANHRRAASSVELRFGPDATILKRIDEPGVDRKRVCEIAVSLYGGVLGRIRDHGEAQALLRYLMDPPPDDAPAASTTGATPSPAP